MCAALTTTAVARAEGRPADLTRIAPIRRSSFRKEALGGVLRPSAGLVRPIGQAISAALAGGGWPRSLSLSRYESPFRLRISAW